MKQKFTKVAGVYNIDPIDAGSTPAQTGKKMPEEKITNICDEVTIQRLKAEQMGENRMPNY